MKRLDAHGKLLSMLCVALAVSISLMVLSGCGGLLPEQKARSATPFDSYDQLVESFDQIVPGMTHAEDLPNLGFNAHTGKVDVLSYLDVQERFMPAAGMRREHLNPAIRACIRAEIYCTGFVFHLSRAETQRGDNMAGDLLGFYRIAHRARWSADIVLLVMNGRVIHKVFSHNSRTENRDDKRQLGPLQDAGRMVAHVAGATPSF